MHEEPLVCPNCGGSEVFTTQENEPFCCLESVVTTILVPVRNCRACHTHWMDWQAEDIRTAYLFRVERSRGITRSKFANEDERKIYEKVWAE